MSGNQRVVGRKHMDQHYSTLSECRMCGSGNLSEFLHLGHHPLSNAFLKESELDKFEPTFPLRAVFCHDCNLVQLGEVVDPSIIFRDYVYFSAGMPAGKHWRDYAQRIVSEFVNDPHELVVEIGSNDGYFLKVVKENHENVLGVDPAQNIAKQANENGIRTIPEFFSEHLARSIRTEYGQAKVIIGNNVVAHIPDHGSLFAGVKALLSPDGVFVFEAPHMADMFENLAFDTVYHEHYSYLAARPLLKLMSRFGLDIFRVEIHPIQGNSIRVFACHAGVYPIEVSVRQAIQKELDLQMDEFPSYERLAHEIMQLKIEVVALLKSLKEQNKRIAGYGAPAKGNTLLNYFDIGPNILEFVTEGLPAKFNLYTPGTHIPVKNIEEARTNPPDYYLLLAWNYKDVILENEKEFRERGGKFIMPVGRERII